MIDCHCHLADEAFDEDIGQVVERAKQAGVVGAIVVAEFPKDFPRVLQLAQQFPDFVRPALGLHPVQITDQQQYVSATEALYKNSDIESCIRAAASQLCCIGEVGLDFSPRYLTNGDGDKEEQRRVFRHQIGLANELGLAVNVHSRSAGKPVIECLRECGAKNVLLHAFSGNLKSVRLGVEAGFHFSVPPSFTLSKEKESFVRAIPLDRLCLESDSPVLGPRPEERNEPANIALSAQFIADCLQMPVADVVRVTSENARRLFPTLATMCL